VAADDVLTTGLCFLRRPRIEECRHVTSSTARPSRHNYRLAFQQRRRVAEGSSTRTARVRRSNHGQVAASMRPGTFARAASFRSTQLPPLGAIYLKPRGSSREAPRRSHEVPFRMTSPMNGLQRARRKEAMSSRFPGLPNPLVPRAARTAAFLRAVPHRRARLSICGRRPAWLREFIAARLRARFSE